MSGASECEYGENHAFAVQMRKDKGAPLMDRRNSGLEPDAAAVERLADMTVPGITDYYRRVPAARYEIAAVQSCDRGAAAMGPREATVPSGVTRHPPCPFYRIRVIPYSGNSRSVLQDSSLTLQTLSQPLDMCDYVIYCRANQGNRQCMRDNVVVRLYQSPRGTLP